MRKTIRAAALFLALALLFTCNVFADRDKAVRVPGGKATDFEELSAALGGQIFIKDKTVTLRSDVILDEPLVFSGLECVLNGAGCVIFRGGTTDDLIVLEDGASVLLGKEKKEGSDLILTVDGSTDKESCGRLFRVKDGAKLTMNAGVLLTGSKGGAVVCESVGTFRMNDGTISHCSCPEAGGGVLLETEGIFTMLGGVIEANEAKNGGNVAILDGSAAIIAGNIANGIAAEKGGGVYIDGVCALGTVTITGNKAKYGGGIAVIKSSELSGGSVTGNTADFGGGVYSEFDGKTGFLSIARMNVESNTAQIGGGFYNVGAVVLGEAMFAKNIASVRAGGVYNAPEGKITFDGCNVANNECAVAAGVWNDGVIESTYCSILTNRGEMGTAMVNNGKVTLNANSFISPRNVVCVVTNAGEGKGVLTYSEVTVGEYPCLAPVVLNEDGTIGYDYKTKQPLLSGDEEQLKKAAAGCTVLANGSAKYTLTPDARLKASLPLPLIIGLCALAAAVIGTAVVLIVKKKKKA